MAKYQQLNSRKIASLVKAGKRGRFGDGLGLALQISEWNSTSWIFRYKRAGKAKYVGLGPLHSVSLTEARTRARQARQLLLDDKDPLEVKRAAHLAAITITNENIKFEDAVDRFAALHKDEWTNAKFADLWRRQLDLHAKSLSTWPVGQITPPAIHEALTPLFAKAPVTGHRVKQRIIRVLEWCKAGMPVPPPPELKGVVHHAAMAFTAVPALMVDLAAQASTVAAALRFTILTATRSNEALGARWSEIENGVWTIPADRMKKRKEFRVPLSAGARLLLDSLPRDGDLIFANADGNQRTPNCMRTLLKNMQVDGTVHGFRSAFRDWAAERTSFPHDVLEMALAHATGNATEAAYKRTDLLEKRAVLMGAWSTFCLNPVVDAKVLQIGRRA